jgi:hypothetical protein
VANFVPYGSDLKKQELEDQSAAGTAVLRTVMVQNRLPWARLGQISKLARSSMARVRAALCSSRIPSADCRLRAADH